MTAGDDARFRLLLDTLPHPAFLLFADAQAEHYNRAFIDYVGFVPGPGQDARTALQHPDDVPRLAAARAGVKAGRREWVIEARLRRHDGAYRWHRIQNRPFYDGERVVGYLGTAVDIHDVRQANDALERRVEERTAALRESESRYRRLYNRTPMALHSVDAQARLIDVNDTWTELFGWPRHAVLGRSPADFMTQASARRYRDEAWPSMSRSRGETHTVEYEFITRDGRLFDGRLSSRGEFDANGGFVRSWAAVADISAEKRAQVALLRAQRMEAVGQLVAGIAHDFNNLLTAVLGSLELIARDPAITERTARRIAAAQGAATRGARLTAQLLAFSRQQDVAAEVVEVNPLVERVRPLLESTIGAAIEIRLDLAAELPAVSADASQLELAILNLAINARDAMEGSGTLSLSTQLVTRGEPARPEEPEAGIYVAIAVRDDGPGISSLARDRMFEPFFTTKPPGKGSGLGLSQALGLLKQFGGGVVVHSDLGGGTRVELLLPIATGDSTAERPPAPTSSAQRHSRPLRLLVVDDDPAVRDAVAELLRDASHDVEVVGSGAEALDALTRSLPDVVLADVAMPGMSGLELAAEIGSRWPELPILFMTGYAEETLLGGAADHVLRKPFDLSELTIRLTSLAWR